MIIFFDLIKELNKDFLNNIKHTSTIFVQNKNIYVAKAYLILIFSVH